MKASDLYEATMLTNRLSAIDKERAELRKPLSNGGVRVEASAAWINAPKAVWPAIARLIDASLAAEEAALRRRAAQISLSL